MIAIEWDGEVAGDYLAAEIEHASYPDVLCACIERLTRCPDRRWVFSIDVLEIGGEGLDDNGQPQPLQPRSIASGVVHSLEKALADVEVAIHRIGGGIGVV